MKKPLVSICCCTFNHEDYISECIEGFLMQQTSFEIEILIHDDASTDRTADIIRTYEKKDKRIKTIYQSENQYSKGIRPISLFNFNRAKGKYITICEGDDYWTDPKKLQKQVDVFNQDQSVACVVTDFTKKNQEKNTFQNAFISNQFKNIKEGYIDTNKIFSTSLKKTRTTTSMIEKTWIDKIVNGQYMKNMPGDTQIFGHLFLHAKIYFLKSDTGVYRVLPESASHTKSFIKKQLYLKSYIDYMGYLLSNYKLSYRDHRYFEKTKLLYIIRQKAHEKNRFKVILLSTKLILLGHISRLIIPQIKLAFKKNEG